MRHEQAVSFILDALEHERGGAKVYATAVQCARNKDLKKEWTRGRRQAQEHAELLTRICRELAVDPEHLTPARDIVQTIDDGLVTAMEHALAEADPATAELVACDCVTFAQTKARANWELLHRVADQLAGDAGNTLRAALERENEEEGGLLFHTRGWCRGLALQKLGLDAATPAAGEPEDGGSALDATRAEQAP